MIVYIIIYIVIFFVKGGKKGEAFPETKMPTYTQFVKDDMKKDNFSFPYISVKIRFLKIKSQND